MSVSPTCMYVYHVCACVHSFLYHRAFVGATPLLGKPLLALPRLLSLPPFHPCSHIAFFSASLVSILGFMSLIHV